MRVVLERFGFGLKSTLGRLYVPGESSCLVLEDRVRPIEGKVSGETAIPYGTYRVELRTVGGFHGRYGERFPDSHQGMLWLREVPGFRYILIHCGNTPEDTEGCLLLGSSPGIDQRAEFSVAGSVRAYERIYPVVASAITDGDDVEIQIQRRFEDVAA